MVPPRSQLVWSGADQSDPFGHGRFFLLYWSRLEVPNDKQQHQLRRHADGQSEGEASVSTCADRRRTGDKSYTVYLLRFTSGET